ncbi:TPA: glutathione S-transferase family protein [Burkholderia aenigmatica]|uniref:glutathione S-transferase family protein n=1 Tax=Burkholderia sp. AU45251 TaxID=3059204 RepID=UPI00264EE73C|nr:glutathione S-transferase family protein [Burkholderia sp. AU45251]HDR9482142.1 glutathione S-transferase family protein [Burkholderia aenigmatica]MDN7515223.1 glutathione S-transferase family protein [Burkholderia sp. AU45251]HDR9515609.1 glutathione S-transferase family protein [Burkholderia aenigmatica]HDR9590513.1 glutathione S-transferase family protein [Burkholderia aenigmatica]HDR9598886.1 glutathione S-transferase family protein [Burkholderia aenigmatica]
MIDLYTDSSPNGFKATIALEELVLPYRLHHVRIEAGEHQQPDFLALNPHGRIPVITDDDTGITLFESAAILLYLAEKTGRLLPQEPAARWEAIKWLQFHSSSVGPIIGQRVHFELFAEEKIPAAIERYRRLTEGVFAVLDSHLARRPYLAGDDYSIADIAHFGWTHIARIIGFDFGRHRHMSVWHERVAQRPAVRKGITLPEPATGA